MASGQVEEADPPGRWPLARWPLLAPANQHANIAKAAQLPPPPPPPPLAKAKANGGATPPVVLMSQRVEALEAMWRALEHRVVALEGRASTPTGTTNASALAIADSFPPSLSSTNSSSWDHVTTPEAAEPEAEQMDAS